jgi:hypothetical protein
MTVISRQGASDFLTRHREIYVLECGTIRLAVLGNGTSVSSHFVYSAFSTVMSASAFERRKGIKFNDSVSAD